MRVGFFSKKSHILLISPDGAAVIMGDLNAETFYKVRATELQRGTAPATVRSDVDAATNATERTPPSQSWCL